MINEQYYGTKYNYVYLTSFAADIARGFKVKNSNYFKSLLHAALYDVVKLCFTPVEQGMFKKNGKYNEKYLMLIKTYHMDLLRKKLNEEFFKNPKMEELKESKSKKKNIFITESQAKRLNEDIKIKVKANHPVDPDKVKAIAKYMDKTFKRGTMNGIGEDGFPMSLPIVAMLASDGSILRNMTDKQMFYLLQDRFKSLYDDTDVRDRLLKQIIKDWYPKKISKEGLLTVNMI